MKKKVKIINKIINTCINCEDRQNCPYGYPCEQFDWRQALQNIKFAWEDGIISESKEVESQQAQDIGIEIPEGYKLVKEYKSQRLQLLVRPSIKDAIKAEAEAQGLSMNDLANNIFEKYLKRNKCHGTNTGRCSNEFEQSNS